MSKINYKTVLFLFVKTELLPLFLLTLHPNFQKHNKYTDIHSNIMDKNTITGFVLIALVFVGYFYINKPNQEQIAAQQRTRDSIAAVQYEQEKAVIEAIEKHEREQALLQQDSTALFFNARNGVEEFITLKNEKVAVSISTLGARICSATLADYNNQQGNPITLFDSNDNITVGHGHRKNEVRNNINFTIDGKEENINTDKFYFTPINVTSDRVVMRLVASAEKYIDFTYTLLPESYIVKLEIDANNMQNFFPSSTRDIAITWDQLIRQQEKGFTFEQRYSNITYKLENDGTDYLSEISNDKENISEPVDWIAMKNQFFSCIMVPAVPFDNVSLVSDTLNEGRGFLKNCSAEMTLPLDPSGRESTDIHFYFGPNKYSDLVEASSYLEEGNDKDPKLEKLIYFGWPIVRWINRFFIMYLFDWLSGWGLNMGIVLLLLTLIVKAVVYPFTYKSYLSSAKMRALKPHIDAINAKYPKKEDAMKKQQEIMALYSKYGASPMGGCLPMLIQMPIFIALFNFVPNAIELRQQSFLWADDLSSYDALISWNTSIWPIGNHISIFCLLFCVTQILNTYYTSKMQPNVGGSPEQEQQMKIMRWMMYIMPIMFFFMFNEYSSGLNYYYFLSTLISVFIFIYLRQTIKEDVLLQKMEAFYEANKNNPAKRSGMMARLEALQQEQQRILEEQQKRNKK